MKGEAMRLRAIAVCAVFLGLLADLPSQFTGRSAEAGWKNWKAKAKRRAKAKRKVCRRRRRNNKKDDKPQTESRQVQLTLVGTDMGFTFINGENVPTFVDADIFNSDRTLVGTYAEIFEPVWDEDLNFVGLMGVATWTFNGADPSLTGTIMTNNVSIFTGSEFRPNDPFEYISVETTATITEGTSALAGSTGGATMNTTAIFDGFFFLFDSNVTLSMGGDGGDDGGTEQDDKKNDRRRRRCRRRTRTRRRR